MPELSTCVRKTFEIVQRLGLCTTSYSTRTKAQSTSACMSSVEEMVIAHSYKLGVSLSRAMPCQVLRYWLTQFHIYIPASVL